MEQRKVRNFRWKCYPRESNRVRPKSEGSPRQTLESSPEPQRGSARRLRACPEEDVNKGMRGLILLFSFLFLFFCGYLIYIEYSENKKINSIKSEIMILDRILSLLYILKTKFKEKIKAPHYKEKLSYFYIDVKKYGPIISEVVKELEEGK